MGTIGPDNTAINKSDEKSTEFADDQQKYDELVFKQDLSEVYLLLDFISGRPDKQFSELNDRIVDPADVGGQKKLSASEIIRRVSRLRYPPPDAPDEKAQQAAFLLLVKDALNGIAHPARGMTIAYTTMFTGVSRASKTNRMQAAYGAYPSLEADAAQFRKIKAWLVWLALGTTVLSASLLWQVTYGAQLAARFDVAKASDGASAAKVYEALDRYRAGEVGDKGGARGNGGAGTSGASPAGAHNINATCRIVPKEPPPQEDRDSNLHQLCDAYAYAHARLCVAIADVGQYGQFWLFRLMTLLLPMHEPESALNCENGLSVAGGRKGRQEDAQSIVGVLTMISNYVLPILFGLLGTLAAFVRSVQDKVTDSLLSPRDRALSFIRVPLGMMAGVCVGLFLSPTNVHSQIGSNFTISASGIAFLAGYGAEAFFRALDALLARVFTLSFSPAPEKTTSGR